MKLDHRQWRVIYAALIIILMMLICPPVKLTFWTGSWNLGFEPIWSVSGDKIDVIRLGILIMIVVAATALVLSMMGDKGKLMKVFFPGMATGENSDGIPTSSSGPKPPSQPGSKRD